MGPRRTRGEDGATLLLALIFMVAVGLILTAILSLSGNDLANTSNLLSQQSLEFSAGGAVNAAIENVRYDPVAFASPGQNCLPGASVQLSYKLPISVDCVSVRNPTPPAPQAFVPPVTREVTFYACVTASCPATSTKNVVTATVDYVDQPTCSSTSTSTCGSQFSIKSWLVDTADN
ncbi:MAG TPA: hypothetical protein VMB82_05475 [Acidimicrobiales bacterium]|nr:hypothetical protein [Acidimicrobiales bacterium]